MQLNKQAKINAILLSATTLVAAALIVHAECGNNSGPSKNDAVVACRNCTTGARLTGACTWHDAESTDAYCGVCHTDFNCQTVGTNTVESVITYSNGVCTPSGCYGGDPHTNPTASRGVSSENGCGG